MYHYAEKVLGLFFFVPERVIFMVRFSTMLEVQAFILATENTVPSVSFGPANYLNSVKIVHILFGAKVANKAHLVRGVGVVWMELGGDFGRV